MTEAKKSGRGQQPRQESVPLSKDDREEIFGNVETQKRLNREFKQLKQSMRTEEEWFELQPALSAKHKIYNKLIRYRIKSAIDKKTGKRYITGKHRLYICKDYKDPALVAKLRKQGKLKTGKSDERKAIAAEKMEKELKRLRG